MDYSSVILEMLARIKQLESEVEKLKKKYDAVDKFSAENGQAFPSEIAGKRDTTRYMFEGAVYPKNRLVLAVVKAYVRDYFHLNKKDLKEAFEKSLQGSIGVVEDVEIARKRSDYTVRFFTNEKDVIHLIDGDMYVCTQWGILNIPNFLKRAEQLGFEIEAVS